jgi:hypothetical protein
VSGVRVPPPASEKAQQICTIRRGYSFRHQTNMSRMCPEVRGEPEAELAPGRHSGRPAVSGEEWQFASGAHALSSSRCLTFESPSGEHVRLSSSSTSLEELGEQAARSERQAVIAPSRRPTIEAPQIGHGGDPGRIAARPVRDHGPPNGRHPSNRSPAGAGLPTRIRRQRTPSSPLPRDRRWDLPALVPEACRAGAPFPSRPRVAQAPRSSGARSCAFT